MLNYKNNIKKLIRKITFTKRKLGLLKKAAELSMLCNIQLGLTFTDTYGNLINFFSPNIDILDEMKSKCFQKLVYTYTKNDVINK